MIFQRAEGETLLDNIGKKQCRQSKVAVEALLVDRKLEALKEWALLSLGISISTYSQAAELLHVEIQQPFST